ncbi:hypothetical protein [Listeria marthii]|uniref:Uncharacterized protein n=2 Tax=Listeria marthii TaxID=529731 RepID=A0A842CMT8_9LIST|nr:hypothetical protein [Listeria marthii]EFR87763.1 conserved hypothetical protein [Listeria marthii FSL S4-120]MBC1978044.1 hypothetical protein [Listeria marthii]MBC2062470.1 hypothetical protein [Listeria marthii]MBC2122192.1 hypothetical protein [Listeria marthii]MBC2128559.1 hypothetical protein [Listeria marthii]
MYKLLSINESVATRTVELENSNTKTIDTCFDDSALVSFDNNFDFMEIGKEYDCKIKLFGEPTATKSKKSVDCAIIDDNVIVGNALLVKISVNNNIYYVSQEKVIPYLSARKFEFEFTRKDLIQVEDVVHEDLQ